MTTYEESFNNLRPFQKQGVLTLKANNRFILADDQGLGKTVQILMALGNKGLIICPKRLKLNWAKEAKIWRPDLKVIVLKDKKVGLKCPNDGELVITNADILPEALLKAEAVNNEENKKLSDTDKTLASARHKKYINDLAQQFKFVTLILDEAHKHSGATTMRAKKVKWLSAMSGRVWVVTGTPMKGGKLMKLFNLLCTTDLIKTIYGNQRNFLSLAKMKFNTFTKQYEQMAPPSPELFERLSKFMLRRKKEEVLKELPAKSIEYIPVEIEDKEIKKFLDSCEKYIDYDSYQLPQFEEFSTVRAALAKAKLDAAIELIEGYEENETPVLVFCMHRYPLEEIAKRDGWAIINGSTTLAKSNEIVENQSKYKGIALSIKSADVGLTLTHFNQVLFIDTSFDTTENNQAFDRVHRISQTQPVSIKILVADHKIEHHTLKILAQADKNIRNVIEGLRC